MTAEQIAQWKVERDIARKSGDAALIQEAYDHRDNMMMECISHQAVRTKLGLENDAKIEAKLDALERQFVSEIPPLQATAEDYRQKVLLAQGAKSGAKWLWDALKVLVGAGGATALIKALGG